MTRAFGRLRCDGGGNDGGRVLWRMRLMRRMRRSVRGVAPLRPLACPAVGGV